MKLFKTISTLTLAALLTGAATSRPARAQSSAKTQNVTVSVDGTGYHPSTLRVKAGQPVRLTFVSKAETCGNSVVIPALKKSFNLKVGQKREVVWTPKKGQTLNFACAMTMFKGKITAG